MNDNTPAYYDGSLADQALGAFAKICSDLTPEQTKALLVEIVMLQNAITHLKELEELTRPPGARLPAKPDGADAFIARHPPGSSMGVGGIIMVIMLVLFALVAWEQVSEFIATLKK
jgi:hypothetical protein